MTRTETQPVNAVARNAAQPLPTPSAHHATCAWCHRDFGSIGELLAHADNHL